MLGSRRWRQWGRLALIAVILGIGVEPGEAMAQSNGASSASSTKAAAHFRAGTKAASAGLWEEARLAFAAAFEEKQHFQIAAHLGRAELKMGHYRDAAEHLSYFLREAKGIAEADLAQSREMLEKALAKVAAVTVRVNVEGAEVFVDGRSVGRSPLSGVIYVEPGRRTFEAKREGYAPGTSTAEMKAGTRTSVELSLGKMPGLASGSEPSGDSVMSARDASGKPVGGGGLPDKWVIIGGAASGALALTGLGLFIGWRVKSGDMDALQETSIENRDKFYDSRTQKNVLGVLWMSSLIASGAVGAATAGYWLYTSKDSSKVHVGASFRVDRDGLGAGMTACW